MVEKEKLLFITTREIPLFPVSGREKTLRTIVDGVGSAAEVVQQRILTIFDTPSIFGYGYALCKFLFWLFLGRPLPLQCLIFAKFGEYRRIANLISTIRPKAVYFDGIRSGIYIPDIRKRYPALRIVCDFDDLMSRRMAAKIGTRDGISAGYLSKIIPLWVQRKVLDGFVVGLIRRYEAFALAKYESVIENACDGVVLVSGVDAKYANSENVVVIPPSVNATSSAVVFKAIERFVFIGTDELAQNRQTIDYLLDVWGTIKPKVDLIIYGKQTRSCQNIEHVIWAGFADRLEDVYTAGSVLLAPSFVEGGVKTKVLEALSYGVPVIGNQNTFEGIQVDSKQLQFSNKEIFELLECPCAFSKRLSDATNLARIDLFRNHGADVICRRWCKMLLPSLAD